MTITAPATYNDGTPLSHPETFVAVYLRAIRKFRREPNRREAMYLADELTSGFTDPNEEECAAYAVWMAHREVYGPEKES